MKCYKRVASAVMGMAMAASCMAPITAYAMEDTKQPTDNTAIANHPNNETMLHSTPVYRIGAKSFYKVNDDGSVVYADQDAEVYTALPALILQAASITMAKSTAFIPPKRLMAPSRCITSRFLTASRLRVA